MLGSIPHSVSQCAVSSGRQIDTSFSTKSDCLIIIIMKIFFVLDAQQRYKVHNNINISIDN